MPKWIARLVRVTSRILDAMAELSVVSLLVLTAVVMTSVIMRYVFDSPLMWGDEVATYSLLALVFLGMAHTLRIGGHIRVKILTDRLPPRVGQYAWLASYLLGTLFAWLLLLGCWARFHNFWMRGTLSRTDLATPLYIPATLLLVGAAALLLIMVVRLVQQLYTVARPEIARRFDLEPPGEELGEK